MSVASHLQPGEEVLYQAHPSRMPLVLPLAVAVLAAAGGLVAWKQTGQTWVWVPAGVLLAVALGLALVRYMRLVSCVYVVTDRRLLRLRGLLSHSSMDSYLDKINNVEHRQTFWGRIFGYGDLEIDTASETGAELFPQISHPLAFKRAIDAATSAFHVAAVNRAPAPALPATTAAQAAPAGVAGHGSGADKIRQLKQLLDEGLISQAEFDAKRKQLLDQI